MVRFAVLTDRWLIYQVSEQQCVGTSFLLGSQIDCWGALHTPNYILFCTFKIQLRLYGGEKITSRNQSPEFLYSNIC